MDGGERADLETKNKKRRETKPGKQRAQKTSWSTVQQYISSMDGCFGHMAGATTALPSGAD